MNLEKHFTHEMPTDSGDYVLSFVFVDKFIKMFMKPLIVMHYFVINNHLFQVTTVEPTYSILLVSLEYYRIHEYINELHESL